MAEPPAHPAAAIDIGSNSIHLLVARLDGDRLTSLLDVSELLGLGAVVDLEGRIPESERDAAIEALVGYVWSARARGADRIELLATEPLRRASNRSQFCDAVESATGLLLHVLSPEVEAELTMLGVLGGAAVTESTLVLDIGGGSTELILLAPGGDPVVGVLPVGSARLTAGFVEDDPPTADELEALRTEAVRLLSGMPTGHPRRGICVGGTGSNLLLLTGGRLIYRSAIEAALALVAAHPSAELVARYGLRARRARQMAAGVAIIEAAMACYELDRMEVSEASLREGVLRAAAMVGDAWPERLDELVSARG
jgi:exopolyphosphatase/guanosine-5'-triphosphate,3'-diphosphate pyrophosphatase